MRGLYNNIITSYYHFNNVLHDLVSIARRNGFLFLLIREFKAHMTQIRRIYSAPNKPSLSKALESDDYVSQVYLYQLPIADLFR